MFNHRIRILNSFCLAIMAVSVSTSAAQTQVQARDLLNSGVPIKNGVDNHDNDTGLNVGKPILVSPKKSEEFESSDSRLYPNYPPCTSWIDDTVPTKMAVLCIHGLGLNTDAFNNLGRRLAKQGIATYAIDVRGFGSWLRNKDHDQLNFKATLADIGVTLQAIKAANKNIPLFLLGESMGGAIALKAAAEYQNEISGLISSAPSGERYETTKTDIKVAVKFLTGPHKQFDIGKSIIDQATENKRLRQIWENDPLNRQDLSADELMRFQAFMNKVEEAAKKIDLIPVLMLQGTLDKLVKPEGTWQIFNHIASLQKTFIALPSEHLVLEDGQVKSNSYDERATMQVANWMRISQLNILAMPRLSEKDLNADSAPVLKVASNSAPQILIFEAPWCAQCAEINPLVRATEAGFGPAITIHRVNVDRFSEADENLTKQLHVGPLPTYVFVKADGSVDSTLVGRCGAANFLKAAALIAH